MPLPLNLISRDYRETFPFRVEILDYAIDHLIADTREAYRVYELMMIHRPGDVLKYLWVKLIEVPDSVTESLGHRMKEWFPYAPYSRYRWPDGYVPLTKFDSLFYWCGNDTTSDSQAWLRAREGSDFINLGNQLFDRVRQSQAALRCSDDPLIQTELAALDVHRHFHDHDAEAPFEQTAVDYESPTRPKRSPAYYEKLAQMLARQDVRMVSSLGDKDYQTVKMVCEAQRRRSLASGESVHSALPFHILSDGVYSMQRWNASFTAWCEGLGDGDLLLDGDRPFSGRSYVIDLPSFATRLALTYHSEIGEIAGYTRTEGDGWVLYEDLRADMGYAKRIQSAFDKYLQWHAGREQLDLQSSTTSHQKIRIRI